MAIDIKDGAGVTRTLATGSGAGTSGDPYKSPAAAALGATDDSAASTDTGTFSILAFIKRALQNWTSLLAKLPTLGQKAMAGSVAVVVASDQSDLPITGTVAVSGTATIAGAVTISGTVTPAATESHLGAVGGAGVTVAVEFTRPADTTAYTAGDVVSNSTGATTVQAVANFARVNGGTGYIVGARLTTDKKSITPRFRVHLFNASTPTVSVDNAAWRDLYADESKCIGSFDLPAMVTGTDTTNSTQSWAEDHELRIPFACAGGTRSIFFVLETLDAFTPASGQKLSLTLRGDVD